MTERERESFFSEDENDIQAHKYARQYAGPRLDVPGSEADRQYWEKYWDLYWEFLKKYDTPNIDVFPPSTLAEKPVSRIEEFLALLHDLLQQGNSERRFFPDREAQRDVFEICHAISEYIIHEGIQDLIIADRSARPLYVGVMEYFRLVYPDKPMPGIFFINPLGFKNRNSSSIPEVQAVIVKGYLNGDAVPNILTTRYALEVEEEFATRYRRLMDHKAGPVLLFDTCIHTGNSLEVVRDTLARLGFTDLRIGSVNPSDPGATVMTDFAVRTRPAVRACYPFDKDRLVEKTLDSVSSRGTPDATKRAAARLLRDEIRNIIREGIAGDL